MGFFIKYKVTPFIPKIQKRQDILMLYSGYSFWQMDIKLYYYPPEYQKDGDRTHG